MQVPLAGGLVFVALALLTVFSAAAVALSRNIVRAAFSLLGAFIGVAGLYLFIAADFVGMIQVMVYVGGVLILFLFAVMLTSRITDVRVSNVSRGVLPGLVVAVLTLGALGYVALGAPWKVLPRLDAEPTTAQIGAELLGRYVLPFEVASVLLVAALIGGVLIADHRRRGSAGGEEGAEG